MHSNDESESTLSFAEVQTILRDICKQSACG